MPTSPTLYGTGEDPARTAKVERQKQEGQPRKPDKLVARYFREIERYKRATNTWYEAADAIVDLYLREGKVKDEGTRTFALLWANVQTIQPAVYSRLPVIQCSRRWKDKDPIGRTAAELQERATNTTLELYGAHTTFKYVRDDRLLAGRGQAWVRHEASFEQYAEEDDAGAPKTDDKGEPVYGERLKGRKVCVDYVHYRDFGHNVAPVWADVWLVWRCVYKTADEVADLVNEKRWDKEVAAKLSYTHKPPASVTDGSETNSDDRMEDCAKIYELWDRKNNRVSWLGESGAHFLETGEPPLKFREFFPCPEACYATRTSKKLVPTPDYAYYRDQAKEINDLTAKIANLCDWLRLKAFMPSGPSAEGSAAILAMLKSIQDQCMSDASIFVPVESWAAFSEKGAGKLIEWLPIREVAETLRAAIEARNQLIQDVYQLIGVSDIVRGQSDPNETLGAQELKTQTSSRRAKETRDDMARWCKDIGALVAEVIADEYEPEQLAEITGYRYQPAPPIEMAGLGGLPGVAPVQPMPQPAPAQPGASLPGGTLPPVPGQAAASTMPAPGAEADSADQLVFDDRHIELLRSDKLRSFRIDVETDSTAQPDEDAEKQRRVEFVEAVGGILERAVPLVAGAPMLMPVVGEVLKFTARGFRAGRQLEEVIDRTMDQLVAMAANPPPDPEQAKAEAQAQVMQQEAALKAEIEQQKLALEQQKAEAKMALEQAKLQHQMQLEAQKAEMEARISEMQAQNDAAMAQQQMQLDAQGAADERQQRALDAEAERDLNRQSADADRQLAERNASADRDLAAKNAAADRKLKPKGNGARK